MFIILAGNYIFWLLLGWYFDFHVKGMPHSLGAAVLSVDCFVCINLDMLAYWLELFAISVLHFFYLGVPWRWYSNVLKPLPTHSFHIGSCCMWHSSGWLSTKSHGSLMVGFELDTSLLYFILLLIFSFFFGDLFICNFHCDLQHSGVAFIILYCWKTYYWGYKMEYLFVSILC